MNNTIVSTEGGLGERIKSIDVLRGLTILLMIFVNDLAGVNGTPWWMMHFPEGTNGMTFVDVIFPAFLFITGMSIPFAIGKRMDKGEPKWQIWKHILLRSFYLIVIGVFMVNTETFSDKGLIDPNLWSLLMYTGIILIWNMWSSKMKPGLVTTLRIAGIALLLVLVFLYRGNDATGIFQMRTQWFGIIGLIGWAYLVACTVYFFFRRNPVAMTGAVAILYCVFFANFNGFFAKVGFIGNFVGIGDTLGSEGALVLTGTILGMILTPDSPIKTHWARIRWAFFYGLGLAIAGVLINSLAKINTMFIIDKDMATPAWCLLGAAWTVWIWIIIYLIVDVLGWKRWTAVVEPAGSNALFAYILAPMIDSIIRVFCLVTGFPNYYDALGSTFNVGIWRSIVMAFGITWLAGGLRYVGIRLKL